MKNIIKLAATFALFVPAIAFADYSVIVNKDNGNTLDKDAISKIYMLRESRFESGNSINAYTYSDTDAARNQFDEDILGRDTAQINSHWSRLSFSGRGTPPTTISSYDEMLQKVSTEKYAVGYVPSNMVNDSVNVVLEF